jgi:hypothetical protein
MTTRFRIAPIGALILLVGPVSLAVGESPESVLIARGLVHSESFFLLPAEEKVVNGLGPRQLPPGRIDFLYNQYKQKNTKYYLESGDVWEAYGEVSAAYKELGKDEVVKAALGAVRVQKKFAAQLGPSKALKKAIGSIQTFETDFPPVDPKRVPRFATRSPAKGLRAGARQPDAHKARERLVLAREAMNRVDFSKNAVREPLKRHVLGGMNIVQNEMKAGTVAADRLDGVRKDLAALQSQRPMNENNIDILNQAAEYLAAAIDAL